VNVLSLFSGVGGIDLGFERAGMRVVGQCEADRQARLVLQRHWPDVPCHPDVTELDAEWLRSNGMGLAERCGNRVGANDGREYGNGNGMGRGDLLRPVKNPDAGRVDHGELEGAGSSERPEYDGGRRNESTGHRVDLVCGGFPCQDLSVAGKRKGFDGERSVLFYEAARVADLVLRDGGWLVIENVPGLFSSNSGRDFGAVLASLAELGFYDCAWRVLDSRYFGVPQRRRRVFIVARHARGDGAKQVLLEPEGGGGDFAPRKQAGKGFAGTFGQGIAGTLGNGAGKRGWKVSAEDAASGKLVEGGGVTAKCVTTSQERQDFDTQGFVHSGLRSDQAGVRRLTPTECERLQGFPDGWTIPDPSVDPGNPHPKPDGPRYAQMGNAVTVPVAEWLGNRIMDWERS
jgi:DNA (cytosine-5)-methyltransferase 1